MIEFSFNEPSTIVRCLDVFGRGLNFALIVMGIVICILAVIIMLVRKSGGSSQVPRRWLKRGLVVLVIGIVMLGFYFTEGASGVRIDADAIEIQYRLAIRNYRIDRKQIISARYIHRSRDSLRRGPRGYHLLLVETHDDTYWIAPLMVRNERAVRALQQCAELLQAPQCDKTK